MILTETESKRHGARRGTMRRQKRRTTWIERHNAWLDTPAGSYSEAHTNFNSKQALGWPADDEVRYWGRRALEIGEANGFDVSGLKKAIQQFEERVAAR